MKKRPILLIILVFIIAVTLFSFPGSIYAKRDPIAVTYNYFVIASSPFNESITIDKTYNNFPDALSAAKNMAHVAMYRSDVQDKIAALNNEEFLNYLYDALFHRAPDTEGLANWLEGLNNGLSKSFVTDYFINSTEFEVKYIYHVNYTYESNIY